MTDPDRVAVAVDNGRWGNPCCLLLAACCLRCGTTCYRNTVRSGTVFYGTLLLLW